MEYRPIVDSASDSMNLDQTTLGDCEDFMHIFEAYEDDETIESPFKYFVDNCDYVEPLSFASKIPIDIKILSYFHLNCRGLSSNWEHFTELMHSLNTDTFNFDVIGISECYRHEYDNRIHLEGYHDIVSRNRKEGRKGGIGLFINETIKFKVRDDISVFIPHVFESIFVELETGLHSKEIVGVIYRPNTPPLADIDIFTENISEIMNTLNNDNVHATIMGDMNIDLMKYGCHEITNSNVDSIFSNGFIPVITKPTRIGNTSATLIDHKHSNNITAIVKSGIIITDVADHYGVYYMVRTKLTKEDKVYVDIRKFNGRNTERFLEQLSHCDFTDIMLHNSADASYDAFLHLFISIKVSLMNASLF